MTNDRKRLIAGAAGAAAIGVAGIIPAMPAHADPDIKDVRKKVDGLYDQAEKAQEQYNDAKLRMKELRKQLKDLKADEDRQKKDLDGIRGQLRDSVLRQFEGSGISEVGQVISSDDPKEFLAGLATVSSYNALQADLLARYNTDAKSLEVRREAVEKRQQEIAQTETKMRERKAEVDKKYDSAKRVLDNMEAKERAAYMKANAGPSIPGDLPPPSGRAKAAVDFAMAQNGDSYVYGAAGPDSWDCSGLTMVAWQQAGVSLPHSAAQQYNYGHHIPASALKPGDLMFYYSPIGHVTIYIGNGLMVSAPTEGEPVAVVPLSAFSGQITGATRLT